MRNDHRRDGALWPLWAHSDESVCRGVLALVHHHAVMLAMPAAACRKAGVRVLRKCEQRRNHGKREGREQQDGEQASHETWMRLVYGVPTNNGSYQVPVRL